MLFHLPYKQFTARAHQRRIRRYFKQRFVVPAQTVSIDAPVNIMVFVNRSGSTLISEYLQATGAFSEFGEPLSSEMVIARSEASGADSLASYLEGLYQEISASGRQVGFKASFDQAMMLLRSQAIPHLFANVRWIFVQRLDIVSQAISFCIAKQTNHWHSFESANGAKPRYVFKDIEKTVRSISRTYADSMSLLSLCNISPYHLTYEQFLFDPIGETEKLSAFLGIDDVIVDTDQLRLKKQSNEINQEFRAMFLRDFKAGFDGG